MAEFTGSALYVAFGGVVVATDFREWKDSREMGLVDASAGADTSTTYLATLKDGTASLKGLIQSGAADGILTALAEGTSGTLQWGPEGAGSGAQKYSVAAIVKKLEKTVPYKDVVEFSADFQFSDSTGVVPGTY
jgi:hypothetical protein